MRRVVVKKCIFCQDNPVPEEIAVQFLRTDLGKKYTEHGRNERGGRGGRVPLTFFWGGDRPPHFGLSDVEGTVPPTL